MKPLPFAWLGITFALVLTPEARAEQADPASPDPAEPAAISPQLAQARDAFRLGSALAREGQWNEALAALERSQQLHPHPVTAFNIGYAERALGHYTRARRNLRAAIQTGDGEPLPPDLAQEARSYLAEIDSKLARLVVSLEAGTAIAIDGRPLEPETAEDGKVLFVAGTSAPGAGTMPGAATFDLIADPGRHVVVLSRPGAANAVLDETFAAGTSARVRFAMDPEPAPAAAAASTAAGPEADAAPPGEGSSHAPWTWVAYGVGAAGLATGSVFGILAMNKKSSLDGVCRDEGGCPPERQGDIDRMNTFALVATVGFGVGIAGAAVGTYLLLTDSSGSASAAPTKGFSAKPWVGLGSAGVSGRF
jgi:hypothetical protein